MVAGEHLQLKVIIEPSTATDKSVTWSSSDNKVVSVDEQGMVTAITEGESSITAKTNDGEKTASCKIKVRAKGVDISKPEISDITSISAFITGTIKPFGVKIQEGGICYSTSQSPTVDNPKVVLTGDEVSYTLVNLEPSTTYYGRFYAIVDGSVKYGDQRLQQRCQLKYLSPRFLRSRLIQPMLKERLKLSASKLKKRGFVIPLLKCRR